MEMGGRYFGWWFPMCFLSVVLFSRWFLKMELGNIIFFKGEGEVMSCVLELFSKYYNRGYLFLSGLVT